MTYILNLKPETARRLEERAKAQGMAPDEFVEHLVGTPVEPETARREKLDKLTRELFDERRSAYEALAEGAK